MILVEASWSGNVPRGAGSSTSGSADASRAVLRLVVVVVVYSSLSPVGDNQTISYIEQQSGLSLADTERGAKKTQGKFGAGLEFYSAARCALNSNVASIWRQPAPPCSSTTA